MMGGLASVALGAVMTVAGVNSQDAPKASAPAPQMTQVASRTEGTGGFLTNSMPKIQIMKACEATADAEHLARQIESELGKLKLVQKLSEKSDGEVRIVIRKMSIL